MRHHTFGHELIVRCKTGRHLQTGEASYNQNWRTLWQKPSVLPHKLKIKIHNTHHRIPRVNTSVVIPVIRRYL